jgi:hypothetical protein
MDASCLAGLCNAAAQTADVAVGAASTGASAPSDAGLGYLIVIGVCLLLAQLLTRTVVRRYEARMLGLMNESSHQAFGGLPPGVVDDWPADRLLAGIAGQRRQMTRALVTLVVLYAVAATAVHMAFGPGGLLGGLRQPSSLTFFLTYLAFSAPVVMLGLSAARFERLFWRWVAPALFVTLALHGLVISGRTAAELPWDLAWGLPALLTLALGARHHARRLSEQRQRLHRWVASGRRRKLVAAVSAAVLAWLFWTVMNLHPGLRALAISCLFGGGCVLLISTTMVDRVRRIVTPVLAAAGFAGIAVGFIVGFSAHLAASALPSYGPLAVALTAGVLAALIAGYLVLGWIGLAYEHKVFSDAQFQVFCWMLSSSFCVVVFHWIVARESPGGNASASVLLALIGCSLLALLGYSLTVRYVFHALPTNRRLLVLRVFSADGRGEQLMEELEERWRTIGPIMLIGGLDVAARTIDPAKAANFLRGRPQDICVPSLFALRKRIAAMDESPDPDGRYRVNEFFCTSDLWQDAVRLLLDSADAVVVDLSEFDARRAGTAYELGLLKTQGALSRTVAILSPRTRTDDVCAALGLAAGSPLPLGGVIQADARLPGEELTRALVQRLRPAWPHGATAETVATRADGSAAALEAGSSPIVRPAA